MAENTTALVCPKCAGGELRGYERNGVSIDQCDTCRGIFLDRGELERLIDAESRYYQPPKSTPPPGPGYGPGYEQPRGGGHPGGGDKHGGYGQRRKRGGFLGELFD